MKINFSIGVQVESGTRVCHVFPALLFQERVSGRQQLLRIACNNVAKGDLLAGIS